MLFTPECFLNDCKLNMKGSYLEWAKINFWCQIYARISLIVCKILFYSNKFQVNRLDYSKFFLWNLIHHVQNRK